jgi:hypothetical protein
MFPDQLLKHRSRQYRQFRNPPPRLEMFQVLKYLVPKYLVLVELEWQPVIPSSPRLMMIWLYQGLDLQ